MLPLHYVAAYIQARLTKNDDEGATAVEYGLLVTLIAIALITGATLFGNKIGALFTSVGNKLVAP
ncbi:Flp family type IVb pilin [Actinoplanes sp. LDG1-06]|uniref:Flp family type IVb pilin n=1 Tax=Paractinoplanes ovalisporus TaxID=2810368 RepID=A0ABS2AK72_9ACTN|nr:Flp family type IVb pilin [Actinoplanes ovalisporus]MBM2620248.1 Flp family type IVb pilin [Actinoplanes ovalisporus]